MYKNLIHY